MAAIKSVGSVFFTNTKKGKVSRLIFLVSLVKTVCRLLKKNITTNMYSHYKKKVGGHIENGGDKLVLVKVLLQTLKLGKVPHLIIIFVYLVAYLPIMETLSGAPCIIWSVYLRKQVRQSKISNVVSVAIRPLVSAGSANKQ